MPTSDASTRQTRPGKEVKFPDGSVVFGLNIDDRKSEDFPPDFGLYLDRHWAPTWNAVLIPWEDFERPDDVGQLFREVRAAFLRAKAGQWVEVGCLAGCGRTGTVLACMAVLAGVPVSEAVTWTRRHYDPDAVETPGQEELVREFGDHSAS